MKTPALLLLGTLVFLAGARSQTPTYEYRLMNDLQVSATVYEFDIYLKRTGATGLEVANTQVGLNFNPLLRNGGTVTMSLVGGTSEFVAAQVPTSFFVDTTVNILRVSARLNPGAGNGTVISATGNGTRFGRFRLTNTAPFGAVNPDLSWNFVSTPPRFPSRLSAYIAGAATDITVPSSHFVSLVNPILNVAISGVKYNDTNGNGTRDGGEAGIQNWRIRLSRSGVQVDSALTDATGAYTFTNLTAGGYTVAEESRAGWIETSSPASYAVTVAAGTGSAGNDFGNFQTGTINGLKYNDTNGNGVKDGGEPGLSGWRIRLSKAGVQLDSILTDGSGNYGFSGLTAGTYVVSEASQAGWVQTSSPATYSVGVVSGTVSASNTFGNFQLGTISGTKYNDTNGNGVKDGGEPGLPGWRIRLSKAGVQLDSILTDGSGNYSFGGLTAGTYTLSEQQQAGWIQVGAPAAVPVSSGTVSTGNNFGNFQTGTINGVKYNDTNGNGVKDGGEPGLSGWRIRLSKAGVQVDSALTDGSGNYGFSGLTAGTYTLSEQQQAGWIQVSAPAAVPVTSGTASAGNNFGNFQTGTISGSKYNDANGNGAKDGGEPGLSGWRIRLSKAGVPVDSLLTDGSGNYGFTGLTAGTYVVSEASQAGWVQTSSPATYTIVVVSGTVSTGNTFGNFQIGAISGTKYNDTNGNGAKDGGEPGIAGWRIRLSRAGLPVDSLLTDGSGNYSFGGLTAGTYVVSEASQAGWVQTSSPATYTVGVVSGTSSAGNTFGNFQLGAITGTKYNDTNGNGVKDGGEPGIAGWRIRLSRAGLPVDSVLTDGSGNYSFSALTAGSYVVSEASQAGWVQTSTPATFSIGVVSGTVSAGNNFGNFQTGAISGVKYNDTNGNGAKDGAEPGIAGWRIRLSRAGLPVDSVLTDGSGNYSFGGLTAGTYVVSEAAQPGWIQTSSPATYTVVVVSGTVSANDNFGNFQAGSISGTVYNDLARNGLKDGGDPGLQGWRVRLTKAGVQVDSTLTDLNGGYAFTGLTVGTYVVSEVVQGGWVETSSPATHSVAVVSGTASAGKDFGNFRLLQLTLTALVEGMYDQGAGTVVRDTVRVELHLATAPYAKADEASVYLSATGQGVCTFTSAANGTPYYIVLLHRNAIETWSASAQTFIASALTYDFTTGASKAFGANEVQKGTKWCLYSGDCEKDGWVDGLDMNLIDNNSAAFLFGYYPTDLNGDNWTDGLDMNLVDNNSADFVYAHTPLAAAGARVIARARPARPMRAGGSSYEMALANDVLEGPATYAFDVLVRSTADTLLLANLQLGLSFNAAVRDGGTLALRLVPGSSQAGPLQAPARFRVDTLRGILAVAPRPNPGPSAAAVLPPGGGWTRLGRFRLENSVPFGPAPLDLGWNFSAAEGRYPSRVSVYGGRAVDVTAPDAHVVRLANAVPGAVPMAFALEANYPNPFNPSTTIRFSVPAAATVTLTVYDLLGRVVAVPLDGAAVAPGRHDVTFDAGALSSGTYFYRLRAESADAAHSVQTSIRKMLLMK